MDEAVCAEVVLLDVDLHDRRSVSGLPQAHTHPIVERRSIDPCLQRVEVDDSSSPSVGSAPSAAVGGGMYFPPRRISPSHDAYGYFTILRSSTSRSTWYATRRTATSSSSMMRYDAR